MRVGLGREAFVRYEHYLSARLVVKRHEVSRERGRKSATLTFFAKVITLHCDCASKSRQDKLLAIGT